MEKTRSGGTEFGEIVRTARNTNENAGRSASCARQKPPRSNEGVQGDTRWGNARFHDAVVLCNLLLHHLRQETTRDGVDCCSIQCVCGVWHKRLWRTSIFGAILGCLEKRKSWRPSISLASTFPLARTCLGLKKRPSCVDPNRRRRTDAVHPMLPP